MSKILHRLSDVSPETRRATCSACGPVLAIRKGFVRGVQRWACEHRRAENIYDHKHGMRRSDIIKVKRGASCAICGSEDKLTIDHSHETGAFRGILCHWCNTAIGLMREDPDRFAKAVAYLADPPGIDIEDAP